VTSLLANVATTASDYLIKSNQTKIEKKRGQLQYPPSDSNPYRYELSNQYLESLTEVEKQRMEKRDRESKLNEEKKSRPRLGLGPLLDPETHTNGSWAEFASVDGVWQMLVGFANAT